MPVCSYVPQTATVSCPVSIISIYTIVHLHDCPSIVKDTLLYTMLGHGGESDRVHLFLHELGYVIVNGHSLVSTTTSISIYTTDRIMIVSSFVACAHALSYQLMIIMIMRQQSYLSIYLSISIYLYLSIYLYHGNDDNHMRVIIEYSRAWKFITFGCCDVGHRILFVYPVRL
jgi:hypothetical protein